MAMKKLTKAKWFWQDYNGTNWNNVEWANSGEEGLGSYVYPKGHSKPRSLFYHYQVDGINANSQKLDKVEFVLIIRKFKESENYLPSIKVFTGDNNAPYKTEPIKKVSSYTRRSNQFWYDEYTLAYNLTGVTIAQLKNIIVEVDWKNSKVNYQTTISVNRGRLEVSYSNKDPKFNLHNTLYKYSATTNEKIGWKLTVKNTGYCGTDTVTLQLPKGMTVASSSGDGSYNTSTKVWNVGKLCKDDSASRLFYLQSNTVGLKNIKAVQSSSYAVNSSVSREITYTQYIPPKPVSRQDVIVYTFYPTFANESRQYFDVTIFGMQENHTNGVACYRLESTENVEIYDLSSTDNVYILSESDDRVYTFGDCTTDTICLLVDETDDFEAHLRIFMECTDDTEGTITTTALNENNGATDGTFDIFEPRGNIFLIDESVSRDKTYVQNSISIGSDAVWNLNSKAHRHNFFDEKKDLMEIEIEEMIAYIGVVPLDRCHKADVTATSKNTLIENRYLNRAYYGKKGDYSEDIKMTLRIPWYDVATLQGLCEMDKPIPIDTIPYFPDGDPLNHRGWAEIHEVGNIKKINDFYYECDVGVTYLTHDILTKFNITEAKKITEANIKFYLSMIHDYTDDLLDLFQLNYYEFWSTLEDANGDKVGSYDIEPNSSLKLNRDLNKYSTYDIVYRNTLPVLMSEDYDGNWEMALRVLNKNTQQTLFEHKYSNFKHYDFDTEYAVNIADADTQYLNNNNFETLNHERIGLGYDNLSYLIEDTKLATHFNTMENITIESFEDNFEIFLLDSSNIGVANQTVKVKIIGEDGYSDGFNVMTDLYGRIIFNLRLNNGEYTVSLDFDETDNYRSCNYSTTLTIDFDYVIYHFDYPRVPTFIGSDDAYVVTVLDDENQPVSDITLHYSFKYLDDEYRHEETVITNSDGQVTIPINQMNGSQMIRVLFKGYVSGGVNYQPVMFEEQLNINRQGTNTSIEADDLTLIQGDNEKLYSIILKDDDIGVVLPNKTVKFVFYNSDDSVSYEALTNDYGVASIPIYLKGDSWKVDTVYDGDSTYKPCIETHNIAIQNFEQVETSIEATDSILNENKLLNEEQEYYSFRLLDNNKNGVRDEPVNVKIYDDEEEILYIDTVFTTDSNGKVSVPFLTHSENVIIRINYNGSVHYKSSSKECVLYFETVDNKSEQTLTKVTESVVNIHTGNTEDEDHIQLRIGGVLQDNWSSDFAIVHSIENERITTYQSFINDLIISDSIIDNNHLMDGTHKVTLFVKGDDSKYSICRTFTIKTVNENTPNFNWWCVQQGITEAQTEITYDMLDSDETKKVGDFAHIRFKLNVWIPNGTIVDIESDSDTFTYTTTTCEMLDENNNRISYFDVYCKLANTTTYTITFRDSLILNTLTYSSIPVTVSSSTKTDVTVSQNGFASNNETYQNLSITVAHNNDVITYDNGYYVIRLLNLETYEELYYYSFIKDNLTASTISFPLTKSLVEGNTANWKMEILVRHNNTYKCGYYTATGRIDTDTTVNTERPLLITDDTKWINIGESTPTFSNDTISTSFQSYDYNSFMALEYTDSNYYVLNFDYFIYGYGTYLNFGHNPSLNSLDGMYVGTSDIQIYNDGELVETYNLPNPIFNQASTNSVSLKREDNRWKLFVNNSQVYATNLISWNNIGIYQPMIQSEVMLSDFLLAPYVTTDITPSTEDYDGSVFGSNIRLELRDNHLNLLDYGMLPSGANTGAKIIVSDVPLTTDELGLELEIKYNNTRFQRLNNFTGEMQMRIYEDVSTSDTSKEYSKVLCSPMPVPNVETVFTRHSDEGILYYVKSPYMNDGKSPTYLCNAYNQYKGGVEITTETGISLFNLDNAHSPIFVSNELLRAEFHRRSGYIKLSRYDETSDEWVVCNVLKLQGMPQLTLIEYNDDYCEILFGKTTWKFYRGRPFIVCNHKEDDIRILNLVDRVYCETFENDRAMGFIEEHDATSSTFNPPISIQQFKQELNIGQNIKLDNFELYEAIDGSNNIDLFFDNGTTASHNDHWYINSYGTATVQSDGTKLLNTSGNTNFVMRNIIPSNKTITESNSYSYNPPFVVEFDIVETDATTSSNDAQVQIYSAESTSNFAQAVTTGHYKIKVTSEEQKIWLDGTLIKTTNLSLPNARITLRVRNSKYLIYKNFKVYQVELDVGEVATNSQLGILNIDNDNALQIYKDDTKLALNFPSYSSYVKRVGDTFSLLISYVDSDISTIRVKARGFDDRGAVPISDGIQYGIWEQTQTASVSTTETDEIRVTFTDCPTDVKYLDFLLIMEGNSSANVVIKDLMYYEGDSIINYDIDNSLAYAERVEVLFNETYYANLYNEEDNCGLCVIRPNQHKISLTKIYASEETVFVPYMKKATDWDKPSQVFLEYLNSKRQIIDIDWRN